MKHEHHLSSLCLAGINDLDERIQTIYSKISEVEASESYSILLLPYKELLNFESFFLCLQC